MPMGLEKLKIRQKAFYKLKEKTPNIASDENLFLQFLIVIKKW